MSPRMPVKPLGGIPLMPLGRTAMPLGLTIANNNSPIATTTATLLTRPLPGPLGTRERPPPIEEEEEEEVFVEVVRVPPISDNNSSNLRCLNSTTTRATGCHDLNPSSSSKYRHLLPPPLIEGTPPIPQDPVVLLLLLLLFLLLPDL